MGRQQQHEAAICRFIRGVPDALYDIGVGHKTEWHTLSQRYPTMKVFGCEPHPGQHATLLKKGFPGQLARVAIGQDEGTAVLHVPSKDLMCCSLFPVPYADDSCEVEVWTLDRFDEHAGQPDRILLWIDIEGSELAAFRSGGRLLQSGRVRWINLEERRDGHCPAAGWADPQMVHGCLTGYGYVRVASYNRHSTHQDAIYIHNKEQR